MNTMRKLFIKFFDFAKRDIWRIRRTELPPGKSFFINLLRILILSIRGFDEDKCRLRVSVLYRRNRLRHDHEPRATSHL